ncbi:MAG: hypothetical protein FWD32_00605 [Firmicutes bacterium]|nr:hypothetical protein [Bacillota bacterium]
MKRVVLSFAMVCLLLVGSLGLIACEGEGGAERAAFRKLLEAAQADNQGLYNFYLSGDMSGNVAIPAELKGKTLKLEAWQHKTVGGKISEVSVLVREWTGNTDSKSNKIYTAGVRWKATPHSVTDKSAAKAKTMIAVKDVAKVG